MHTLAEHVLFLFFFLCIFYRFLCVCARVVIHIHSIRDPEIYAITFRRVQSSASVLCYAHTWSSELAGARARLRQSCNTIQIQQCASI